MLYAPPEARSERAFARATSSSFFGCEGGSKGSASESLSGPDVEGEYDPGPRELFWGERYVDRRRGDCKNDFVILRVLLLVLLVSERTVSGRFTRT